MTTPIKVLHLATEPVWRGGENQVRLLIEGSRNGPIEHHVVVREGSEPHQRFAEIAPVIPIKSGGRFDLPAAYRLARYCQEEGIQILDAQSSHGHNLGLMIKLKEPYLKLVVHRRVDYPPGRDLVNSLKYKSQLVDRYIAISSAIGKILGDYGINREKIAVVPSAVCSAPYQDLDKAAAKRELAKEFGVDPNLPFIGNASALTEQKGWEVWLQTAALLKKRNQPFHGFIAGKGHLQESLLELRDRLGLKDQVTFLGFRNDVPQFLSGLDVLFISSHFEGLGTILLEGIYAKCLIVATAVGGIPEIVKNEKTGLLAPPNNPDALANLLEKGLGDEPAALLLRERARQHIDTHFSLSAMVQGNIAVYSGLLTGS